MLVLRGHRGPVVGLAYSPDGRTLASASFDGTARLWDVRSGQLRETLQSSGERAYCVTFSADGKKLAIGYGRDHGLLQLWALDPLRRVESWSAHSGITRGVAFGTNGQWLVSCGAQPSLAIWDLSPFLDRSQILGRSTLTNAIAMNHGSGIFATLTVRPVQVRIRQRRGNRIVERQRFDLHSDYGIALALTADTKHIVCGVQKEIVVISHEPRNSAASRWSAHDDVTSGVAFFPDSQSLLSAATDGLVKHWSLSGELLRTIDWQIGELGAVAIAPDGLTAAVGGAEDIVVWDLE